MKRLSLIVAALAACLLIAACNKLTEGVVTEKSARAGYSTTNVIYAGDVPIYTTQDHPPTWWVKLRGTYNGEQLEEWHQVTSDIYSQVQIGEAIRFK